MDDQRLSRLQGKIEPGYQRVFPGEPDREVPGTKRGFVSQTSLDRTPFRRCDRGPAAGVDPEVPQSRRRLQALSRAPERSGQGAQGFVQPKRHQGQQNRNRRVDGVCGMPVQGQCQHRQGGHGDQALHGLVGEQGDPLLQQHAPRLLAIQFVEEHALGICASVGDQVGQTPEVIQQRDPLPAAPLHERAPARLPELGRQQRRRQRQDGGGQDQYGRRPRCQPVGENSRGKNRQGRRDNRTGDAQRHPVEGVDVRGQPVLQVPAAQLSLAGDRQARDGSEAACAQTGEDAQHGLVPDHALAVTSQGAQQRRGANTGRRREQFETQKQARTRQRGGRDEPPRQRQQGDAGGPGQGQQQIGRSRPDATAAKNLAQEPPVRHRRPPGAGPGRGGPRGACARTRQHGASPGGS